MANGLLEISGTIDLKQFWPSGEADADTTSIKVDVGEDALRFRPSPDDPFGATHVFDDVTVRGRVNKPAISKGKITIRLQGIDATELHYTPAEEARPKNLSEEDAAEQHRKYLELNEKYRQFYAETSAVRLCEKLSEFGEDPLPCRVVTAVDEPEEVFDVYGRLVGDIIIGTGNEEFNVNTWLVEAGYALPALYNSMSTEEISTIVTAAGTARDSGAGLWDGMYTPSVVGFDWNLRYRKKGSAFDPDNDRGPVFMPKLFRRQSAYEVNRKTGRVSATTFRKYLQSKKEQLFMTSDYLENGSAAAPLNLYQQISGSRVKLDPEEIVFFEDTKVILKKPGNAPIVW